MAISLYAPTEDCLRDIPEFIESSSSGDTSISIVERRSAILSGVKDLGPQDMVHLVKTKAKGKSESRQVGSYHFVTGLDSSSSASIAAYVTDLSHSLVGKEGGWALLGKLSSPWRISGATVCCWNAFRKVDVWVELSIPGGVRSYCFDPSSQRTMPTTPAIWIETYVSSMLRMIQDQQQQQHQQNRDYLAVNRVEPFPAGLEDEERFLEACKMLFWDGWKFGSALSPSLQLSSSTNNRLAHGLLAYFTEQSQKPEQGVSFFRELAQQDPSVNELVVQCLIAGRKETEAVALMHKTITMDPSKSAGLLRTQATWLANKAGELEPAEKLIRAAIKLAPMELDGWVNLALIQVRQERYNEALLTLNSFPYIHLETSQASNSSLLLSENGTFWQPRLDFTMVDLSQILPANKQSSPLEQMKAPHLQGTPKAAYSILVRILAEIGWEALLQRRAEVFVMEEEWASLKQQRSHDSLQNEKEPLSQEEERLVIGTPQPAAIRMDELQQQSDDLSGDHRKQKKRLCERWLDSLFLILFEDLRLLTIFQSERDMAIQESRAYQRTPREWLLLGHLASRLLRPAEAKEAYDRCLDSSFSQSAWLGILSLWQQDQDKLGHAITGCISLVTDAVNRRERPVHPSPVSIALRRLVAMHGASRVTDALNQLKPADPTVLAFIQTLLQKSKGCLGSDY